MPRGPREEETPLQARLLTIRPFCPLRLGTSPWRALASSSQPKPLPRAPTREISCLMFQEGALSWSLQCCPLPPGAQWDADATQTLPSLPVLQAGGAVLAAEGQGGTQRGQRCPWIHIWAGSSHGKVVPRLVGPIGWSCSELGLLQPWHLHGGPGKTSVAEVAEASRKGG